MLFTVSIPHRYATNKLSTNRLDHLSQFQSLIGTLQTRIAQHSIETFDLRHSFNPSQVRYKLDAQLHYIAIITTCFNPSQVRYKRFTPILHTCEVVEFQSLIGTLQTEKPRAQIMPLFHQFQSLIGTATNLATWMTQTTIRTTMVSIPHRYATNCWPAVPEKLAIVHHVFQSPPLGTLQTGQGESPGKQCTITHFQSIIGTLQTEPQIHRHCDSGQNYFPNPSQVRYTTLYGTIRSHAETEPCFNPSWVRYKLCTMASTISLLTNGSFNPSQVRYKLSDKSQTLTKPSAIVSIPHRYATNQSLANPAMFQ